MEPAMVLMRFHVLALAVALLLPISEVSFAAQEAHHSSRLHSRSAVVKNQSVITSRADASRMPAFYSGGTSSYPWGPGRNFPYPDRPYGDPDRYLSQRINSNVHFWPLAEILFSSPHVPFGG